MSKLGSLTKEEIEEILQKTEALQKGHFLLSSGLHSEYYMQCAKVLQYPEHAEVLANYLKELISEKLVNINVDYVLAPAMGGLIIGYELARAFGCKSIFAERVDGKFTLRRGFTMEKGSKIIICEDVVTTGLSTREVIEMTKKYDVEIVHIASLIDRTNGKVDFQIPFTSAYAVNIESYEEDSCPLCKEGLELVKPGSRVKI